MGDADWSAFREVVFADPDLAGALASAEPERFVEQVVGAAADRGLAVTTADVEAAVSAGRRAWFERWI